MGAFWGLQTTWDYYKNRRGREGSNYNKKLVQLLTELPSNSPYINGGNISCNPTNSVDVVYLREDNSNSAATLDVLAHEYTHAMIWESSGLGNNQIDGDAASIGEGFADVFGMIVEGWVDNGAYDWSFGEDLGYQRNFENPHDDYPIPSPEKYMDPGYYYSMDYSRRHTQGGVIRKWFWLLSQGGSFNGQTLTGLGLERASDIAYITFNWSLWANIKYPEIGSPILWGTIAHYGRCSNEHKQVAKALKAINIPVPLVWDYALCDVVIDGPAVIGHHAGNIALEKHFKAILQEDIDSEDGIFLLAYT